MNRGRRTKRINQNEKEIMEALMLSKENKAIKNMNIAILSISTIRVWCSVCLTVDFASRANTHNNAKA